METKTLGKRIAIGLTGLGLLVSVACEVNPKNTRKEVLLAERTTNEPVTIRLIQEIWTKDWSEYRLEILDSKGNQITALRVPDYSLYRETSFTLEDGRVYSIKGRVKGFEISQDFAKETLDYVAEKEKGLIKQPKPYHPKEIIRDGEIMIKKLE